MPWCGPPAVADVARRARRSEPKVEPWDVRRAGQIGREQLQAITRLHEGFARSLTQALGAYLRVVFAAALVSAEHLTYREFLERIPETTYLASCKLEPMGVTGALQLDLKVAFPDCRSVAWWRRQSDRGHARDHRDRGTDCRECGSHRVPGTGPRPGRR